MLSKKVETEISKTLSRILRHQAKHVGLTVNSKGEVLVSDLLKLPELNGISLNILKWIVQVNDKQRFSFDKTGLYIRANQGHNKDMGN